MRGLLKIVALIIFFAFVFNFLWESLHAFSLYTDHVMASDKYVGMMVHMSLMDALVVVGIYAVTALIGKDVYWMWNANKRLFAVFFVLGIVTGAMAEYWAVYISHQWHYNARMPVVAGIGLSPLLQLAVTGLTSVGIVRRISP